MNLFINSPSYYTTQFGVMDEVHWFCRFISEKIDIKNYTDKIDTIGIVPMIMPQHYICEKQSKERKYVSIAYRFAEISLFTDYDTYLSATAYEKRMLIFDNVLRSVHAVKKKLKSDFDYAAFEKDVYAVLSEYDECVFGLLPLHKAAIEQPAEEVS